MMAHELTRSELLREEITYHQGQKRRVSENLANLKPKPGYETVFEEEELRIRMLQEMIREMQAGQPLEDKKVRQPAGWQTEMMRSPERATRMDL